MPAQNNNKKAFSTLITVLVISISMSLIALTFLTLSTRGTQTAAGLEYSAQASAYADACAEAALEEIRSDDSYSGSDSINFGNGTCTFTVTVLTGENRSIQVSASAQNFNRDLSVTLDTIFPEINITSWDYN